jgi:hypothetical protein
MAYWGLVSSALRVWRAATAAASAFARAWAVAGATAPTKAGIETNAPSFPTGPGDKRESKTCPSTKLTLKRSQYVAANGATVVVISGGSGFLGGSASVTCGFSYSPGVSVSLIDGDARHG